MLSGLDVNPKVVLTPGEMELTVFVINKHMLYANDNLGMLKLERV